MAVGLPPGTLPEIVDVSEFGIVPFLETRGKTLSVDDPFDLVLNPIKKTVIGHVWPVIRRSVAADAKIEFHLHRETPDTQVFETRAQKCHLGDMAKILPVFFRMLRGDLRHNSICSDDFENVQVLRSRMSTK